MLTYKTEQCPRCNGKGTVRFLILLKRNCPLCNGTGQIHMPSYTHEQHARPFLISDLHPETLRILKNKPEFLNCLSPNNRINLVRKYSELPRLHPTRYVESAAEKQRRLNYEMAHAQQQRQQFEDFMRRSAQQLQNFTNWSNQQHQDWANKQFKNFVAQHRGGGH